LENGIYSRFLKTKKKNYLEWIFADKDSARSTLALQGPSSAIIPDSGRPVRGCERQTGYN
jgi:hypothetical protein